MYQERVPLRCGAQLGRGSRCPGLRLGTSSYGCKSVYGTVGSYPAVQCWNFFFSSPLEEFDGISEELPLFEGLRYPTIRCSGVSKSLFAEGSRCHLLITWCRVLVLRRCRAFLWGLVLDEQGR